MSTYSERTHVGWQCMQNTQRIFRLGRAKADGIRSAINTALRHFGEVNLVRSLESCNREGQRRGEVSFMSNLYRGSLFRCYDSILDIYLVLVKAYWLIIMYFGYFCLNFDIFWGVLKTCFPRYTPDSAIFAENRQRRGLRTLK